METERFGRCGLFPVEHRRTEIWKSRSAATQMMQRSRLLSFPQRRKLTCVSVKASLQLRSRSVCGQRGGVCHQGDLARCSSLLLPSALLIFPLWLTSALTQSKATQRVFHGLAASPPDASDASFSHTQKSLLFFPHICVILEQIRDLGIVQGDSGVFSVCSVSGKLDESGNVSLHI